MEIHPVPKHTQLIIGIIIALISGLILGFLLFYRPHRLASPSGKTCADHAFINQTLDCGSIDENISKIKNIDLRIRNIIDDEKAKNTITRASVFYRDLNTRRWFGINDTEDFYAASLLKLPLSIIYFKLAEVEPNILDQNFLLPKENRNTGEFFTSDKNLLVPGTAYPIKKLIEGMLINSDNNPVPLLNEHIDPTLQSTILHDLGIEASRVNSSTPERYVNVRIYSNILRFLYNASFLNLEYSNTLLEYLSRSTFDQGIVAALPPATKVAHKFGEATRNAADGTVIARVLHDCGIVYQPENPYIICIMTEGKDYVPMSHVIQRIAGATYNLE